MHSELCPVCKGSGKINDITCHGCNGKGWVEVKNGESYTFTYPLTFPSFPQPPIPFPLIPQPLPYFTWGTGTILPEEPFFQC
jgi:hypothetical protein